MLLDLAEPLSKQKKAKAEVFWNDVEIGKEYTGTVKSLTNFGAFVDLGGVDGLVRIRAFLEES